MGQIDFPKETCKFALAKRFILSIQIMVGLVLPLLKFEKWFKLVTVVSVQ